MGFKCGIVGLPNVGKSTLFNALTQTAAAQAANYPFCTIEPNVGDVAVPDPRLETLAEIAGSAEIIPTRITFVDIAGLVRGASKGEGLGNQFLATIREVDAVVHVLRCFQDDDITHVEGRIDPIGDAEAVETELMLADLESLEKRIKPLEKKAKSGEKEAKEAVGADDEGGGAAARRQAGAAGGACRPMSAGLTASLGLMTAKPVLYVCNVEESAAATGNEYSKKVQEKAKAEGARAVVISCKVEEEIAQLPNEERQDFLDSMGLDEPGLNRLIRTGYELAGAADLFHGRAQGNAGLDGDQGLTRAAGGGRHPYRFRAWLHPCRDHRLWRLCCGQGRSGRARCGQVPAGRQGLCRRRWRRDAFPV